MSDTKEDRILQYDVWIVLLCGQNRNHKSFVESLMHFQSVFEKYLHVTMRITFIYKLHLHVTMDKIIVDDFEMYIFHRHHRIKSLKKLHFLQKHLKVDRD